MRTQTHTSLLQNREQARLREVRNTPVITMIEEASLPVLPESRGALVRGIVGLIFGGMLSILWVLGTGRLSTVDGSSDPDRRELIALLREVTPTLLRRWIGL